MVFMFPNPPPTFYKQIASYFLFNGAFMLFLQPPLHQLSAATPRLRLKMAFFHHHKTMSDVCILVMVAISVTALLQGSSCDATIGKGTQKLEEDFTWKYNGEVNIGKKID